MNHHLTDPRVATAHGDFVQTVDDQLSHHRLGHPVLAADSDAVAKRRAGSEAAAGIDDGLGFAVASPVEGLGSRHLGMFAMADGGQALEPGPQPGVGLELGRCLAAAAEEPERVVAGQIAKSRPLAEKIRPAISQHVLEPGQMGPELGPG